MDPVDTSTSPRPGSIVVGIDGDERDRAAIEWAADSASRTHRPVHLMHAYDFPVEAYVGDPAGFGPRIPMELISSDEQSVVSRAVVDARERWPELDITGSEPVGRPEGALNEASRHAYVVVLGSGRVTGLERLLGRTPLAAAMHAACPVVIVPEGAQIRPDGDVVVAVDGSKHARMAAARAMSIAAVRKARLVVLTTWLVEVVDGLVVTTPGTPAWDAVEGRHRALAEAVIEGPRAEHPEVEVEIRVVRGSPAPTILECAADAGLLVMGPRGAGGFRGMLLGSVTHHVLQSAHCPVMVVRDRHVEASD